MLPYNQTVLGLQPRVNGRLTHAATESLLSLLSVVAWKTLLPQSNPSISELTPTLEQYVKT